MQITTQVIFVHMKGTSIAFAFGSDQFTLFIVFRFFSNKYMAMSYVHWRMIWETCLSMSIYDVCVAQIFPVLIGGNDFLLDYVVVCFLLVGLFVHHIICFFMYMFINQAVVLLFKLFDTRYFGSFLACYTVDFCTLLKAICKLTVSNTKWPMTYYLGQPSYFWRMSRLIEKHKYIN